ncbi:MAG: glycogen synthase GlgA [Eubacteriales bacterium]|nr:glycogen synthase GlgA [Eubacteriales bacterium]
MKLFFAASEVAPFIKTGGLADVAGSLPNALAKLGHDVRVILPLYSAIPAMWRRQMTFLKSFHFPLSWRNAYCGLFSLAYRGLTYYFIDNEYYFQREGLYGQFDDGERFAYFSRAVVEVPIQLGWSPDIIHCNDWQTSLVPVYLLEARHREPLLMHTKSVFTIHNIEYQGQFDRNILGDVLGLDESYFREDMLSYYGDVNLVKGAIYAADYITTVSPTYAKELQYAFYAHGLEGVIADNYHKFTGILNGIDMEHNNPATDPFLPAPYSAADPSGKAACKAALQEKLGLNVDPDVPIIACISRLVAHKGYELVTAAFPKILEHYVQFVVLGTGDWGIESFFRMAAQEYPGRVSANLMYSAELASQLYAGADLLLMPSISEPCGLSQMIAMRYGTVPIVRLTGGLKDSVPSYNPTTGTGLGFTFGSITPGDLLGAIDRGLEAYETDRPNWTALMKRGMTTDFSWDQSAAAYEKVYQQVMR